MTIPSVAHTVEFHRVAGLPRRVWAPADVAQLVDVLTDILRTPDGTPCIPKPCTEEQRAKRIAKGLCPICDVPLRLNPTQAVALHDAGVEGGLFGAIGVGEGKTLTSLLLPVVWGSKKPLLLLPGGLIEKTQRERMRLARHWRIPNIIRILSYDVLGRVDAVDELERYEPDGIPCDEVHRLKNKRAAVTRRVARYMHARPETKFAGLSGTVMTRSLKDFAHILIWSLKLRAPVPTNTEEIEEWAEALDVGVDAFNRREPGALTEFSDGPDLDDVRRGFQRRLVETPGVVATVGEGEHVDCSIYVRGVQHDVAPVTEQNFETLRKEWVTPDGWELMFAVDVWRHAQELALGLHYVWDPRPPEEWLTARSAWHKFVRETISRSKTWDSELHVANACDAGELDGAALERWRAVRPTFTPNVVAIWHDDSALKFCAKWAKTPGLIWTEHDLFARKLAEVTGLTYYGAGGFAASGAYIEDTNPGTSAIASIDANSEGKNLQGLWHRNLIVCPPASGKKWQQVIARTHRPGQEADEVIVDVLLGCRENLDACLDALESARAIEDMTGNRQKLLIADVTLPSAADLDVWKTRWVR